MVPFPPGPLASQMSPNLIKWTQTDAEWRPRGPFFFSLFIFFLSRLKKKVSYRDSLICRPAGRLYIGISLYRARPYRETLQMSRASFFCNHRRPVFLFLLFLQPPPSSYFFLWVPALPLRGAPPTVVNNYVLDIPSIQNHSSIPRYIYL